MDAEQGNTQADRETDELAERFFSQPPQAWEVEPAEPTGLSAARLSPVERLALLATVAPVAIGVAVGLALLLFSDPLFASSSDAKGARKAASATHERPRTPEPAQYGLTALAKALPQPVPTAPAATAAPVASPAPERAVTASGAASMAAPMAAPVLDATASAQALRAPSPAPVATARPERSAMAAAAPRTPAAGSALQRARRALDAGDAATARDLANEALARDPERAAGYIVLGGALDALGDRAGMKAAFRACVERAQDPLVSACKSLAR